MVDDDEYDDDNNEGDGYDHDVIITTIMTTMLTRIGTMLMITIMPTTMTTASGNEHYNNDGRKLRLVAIAAIVTGGRV